jgi:hypothetical protein
MRSIDESRRHFPDGKPSVRESARGNAPTFGIKRGGFEVKLGLMENKYRRHFRGPIETSWRASQYTVNLGCDADTH